MLSPHLCVSISSMSVHVWHHTISNKRTILKLKQHNWPTHYIIILILCNDAAYCMSVGNACTKIIGMSRCTSWLSRDKNNFLKGSGSMSAYRPFARQSLGFGLTPLIIALKSLWSVRTFVLSTKPLVGHLVLLIGKCQMADCYVFSSLLSLFNLALFPFAQSLHA
jgi:hypothetical protein